MKKKKKLNAIPNEDQKFQNITNTHKNFLKKLMEKQKTRNFTLDAKTILFK